MQLFETSTIMEAAGKKDRTKAIKFHVFPRKWGGEYWRWLLYFRWMLCNVTSSRGGIDDLVASVEYLRFCLTHPISKIQGCKYRRLIKMKVEALAWCILHKGYLAEAYPGGLKRRRRCQWFDRGLLWLLLVLRSAKYRSSYYAGKWPDKVLGGRSGVQKTPRFGAKSKRFDLTKIQLPSKIESKEAAWEVRKWMRVLRLRVGQIRIAFGSSRRLC